MARRQEDEMNAALNKARAAKNDEFYTLPETIAAELPHYRRHFAGKTVYCNCDMPSVSEFPNYFVANFAALRLKRLIATCYPSGRILDYDGDTLTISKLHGNGDFRSAECIALLRQADIVCTNPPFSLFREYVAQLDTEKKKFLIIGNLNAAHQKEIFRQIMVGKVWLGNKSMGTDMLFNVPPHFANWLKENKKEGSGYKIIEGVVKGRAPAIWYTNLDHERQYENLTLTATYKGNEAAYPKYDNYDAIEVSRVKDIPADYAGVMGVPITFLDKWNHAQFDIVGSSSWHDGSWIANDINYINGKGKFCRVLIKAKPPAAK